MTRLRLARAGRDSPPTGSCGYTFLQSEMAAMATLRFCADQYQHLPLDVLTERWREAERLAFDVVWHRGHRSIICSLASE